MTISVLLKYVLKYVYLQKLKGLMSASLKSSLSPLMKLKKKNNIKKDIKSKVCMHVKLLHLCTTLWDPMDCSPPGCSVHGILQARILEWIVISFAMRSSQPRDRTCVSWGSYIPGGLITAEPPGKPKSKADDCKYDKVIFQRQKISLKKESFYSIWVAVQEKHMTTLYLQPICMKKKKNPKVIS